MSFTVNPFKNITIVELPTHGWAIECNSCGALIGLLELSTNINTIMQYNEAHLRSGHKSKLYLWLETQEEL